MDILKLKIKLARIDNLLEDLNAQEQLEVLVEYLAAKTVLAKKDEVSIEKCIDALQKWIEDEILSYYQTKLKLEGRE